MNQGLGQLIGMVWWNLVVLHPLEDPLQHLWVVDEMQEPERMEM